MAKVGPSGQISNVNRTTLSSAAGINSSNGVLNSVVNPSKTLSVSSCANYNTLSSFKISSPKITSTPPVSTVCQYSPVTPSSNVIIGNSISVEWSTNSITQSISVNSPGTYSVTVTQNNCSATSPDVILNSLNVSSITTQSTSTDACLGGYASFSVIAPGSSNSYQWQRSLDAGINWSILQNDFYYSNVSTANLSINQARDFNGMPQSYRCMVTNGPGYCPEPSDKADLQVNKVELLPFPSVFTGNNNQFLLSGGSPAGGSYSGDYVTHPGGNDYFFHPPPSPTVSTINYAVGGCLPENVSQQIQVIYCGFPSCDAITTNLIQGFSLCFDFASTITFDVPYTILGTIPGSIDAYLSDYAGNFSSPTWLGGISTNPPANGIISCTITGFVTASPNYKIRIDGTPTIIGEPCPYDITIAKRCEELRNQLPKVKVQLHPNPAFGTVSVTFSNSEEQTKEIQIIDLQGRACIDKDFKIKTNNVLLDISSLIEGIYIVLIKSGNTMIQKKLVVTSF